MDATLVNLKDFARTEADAVNYLGAQQIATNYYKADSSGDVQTVLTDALYSNSVFGQFHVALIKSANLNVGEYEFYWSSNSYNNGFDLAQVSNSQSWP